MAKVLYGKTSPYLTTGQTAWSLAPLNLRNVPSHPSDKRITIKAKYHERPDKLSKDLYGTEGYWWVFMVVNPDVIKDPIYDLTTGTSIFVPLLDRLNQVLGS
jgi:hypothetical protein